MLRIFVDPFDGKVTTYYKRLEKNTLKLPIARYSNELRELFRKGLYTPPGGETHSDVDKRVCDFIEDVFEKFHGDEKILVVTHNGIMRAIKRNFMKKTNEIMSKNLGTLVLTEEDYRRYQEKQDFER